MNDNELHNRLRSMGTRPVDADVQESHLRRIESVAPVGAVATGKRFGPVAVAAACVFGFLAGSTGLAMAGALPDQAQEVAHDVLGVVQVDVPAGKEGKRGPCVSAAAKIEDEDAKKAAKDACPKGPIDNDQPDGDDSDEPDAPGRSGDAPGQNRDEMTGKARASGTTKHDDDPCKGRPAWAGPLTKEEREEAKAANSRADCVDDVDDIDDEDEVDDD